MRPSNIGGQAVLEGIMMRHKNKYSVAVRKPDAEIEVMAEEYNGVIPFKVVMNIPFIRGFFQLIDSLVLGLKTLTYSASFIEEDEDEVEELSDLEIAKREKREKILMNVVVGFSLLAGIGIFMLLPFLISTVFHNLIGSRIIIRILEGIFRVFVFLGYVLLISRMKDIQRTFMYHGAEHKCINCIEHGQPLTVENIRNNSRFHKRCGTSFLFFVIIVSIIFTFFITAETLILRMLIRISIIPLIAGVSYEIIRLAGKSNHPLINLLSKPGMAIQKVTAKEPDDGMIEVAIAAIEKIFDWKAFIAEGDPEAHTIERSVVEAESAEAESVETRVTEAINEEVKNVEMINEET